MFDNVVKALSLIFNAGIVARALKIYMDGIYDEDIPYQKKIKNIIKAAIIVNLISVLVRTIAKYYGM